MRSLVLAAPAPLDLPTGGYAYDRRIVEQLRGLGWSASLEALAPGFPAPSEGELAETVAWLEATDPLTPIVIDGLAFGAMGHIAPAFKEKRRLIALVHHPLADETGLDPHTAERLRDGEMLALTAARGVIVTSGFVRHRLDAYGVPPAHIHVVEPGVARRPLSRGGGGVPRLLCVGGFIPRKGQDVLLRALGRIRDRHWRLACIGATGLDPAYEDEVGRLARDLGDRVEILGSVSHRTLEAHYAEADLFVLPSHFEGYGMVFAEAIASGLPIVATTGGAIPDTVPEGTGRLVGPGDVTALADTLADLLDHPERRRELAQRARQARAQQTDWRTAAQRFAAAVEEITGWA